MPAWIQIDMKSKQPVKGFSLVPNYIYRTEYILSMEIMSSHNGVYWISQGTYQGGPTAQNTIATNPDI